MQVIFPKKKTHKKEKKKHKKQKPQAQEEKTQQQNRESVSADMQVKKRKKTQNGVKPIMMIIALWIIIIRNQTAYNNHPKSALSNCGKAALDEATEPWGIKVERVEM